MRIVSVRVIMMRMTARARWNPFPTIVIVGQWFAENPDTRRGRILRGESARGPGVLDSVEHERAAELPQVTPGRRALGHGESPLL